MESLANSKKSLAMKTPSAVGQVHAVCRREIHNKAAFEMLLGLDRDRIYNHGTPSDLLPRIAQQELDTLRALKP